MSESLTTALERSAETPKQRAAAELVARHKPDIARLVTHEYGPDWIERVVRLEGRRNVALQDCAPWSFVGAVVECAQLGLEPNAALGLVYLVPFKKEVTVIVGYRGYVELAYRSGLVKDVQAELVYDGDTFRVVKGTSPKIVHEDQGPPGEREIVAAYAVAHLKTGGTVAKVIYEADWEKARQASTLGAKNAGPWADHRSAMIRKTALRRLEPWLPKTATLGQAFALDEQPATRVDDLIAGELPLPESEASDGSA